MLARLELDGYTLRADKGFAGADLAAPRRELRAIFPRPARTGEPAHFGQPDGVRQPIEPIIDTAKGQLSLEQHGAHTISGPHTPVAPRPHALAA